MAYSLEDYFSKPGLKLLESSLKRVVGKPISHVKGEAAYRMHVLQPAWSALPLGIRMLMKRHILAWEELFYTLRDEVLDLDNEKIDLRPDASARIASIVQNTAGLGRGASAESSPSEVPASVEPVPPPAKTIPLATPIARASSPTIPLAAPIVPTIEDPSDSESLPVIGIDLGTTFSVVAYVDAHGRPCSILNQDGDRLTPSVVHFGDEGTLVGKHAVQRSAFEPDRTAVCVKRDMGAKFYSKPINGEALPPEVISAFVLRSLKDDAVRHLGPVRRAVITVPAYFDETRRRATVDAGRLAGLEVLDIINEPTAAAIAFGYQIGFLDRSVKLVGAKPLRALVFDLGGGTFDVTIVEIGHGAFTALATDGDVNLGGRDWDQKLHDLAAERFLARFGTDPRDDPISAQELWIAVETAKRTLSERQKAVVYVNYLNRRCSVEITREEFEQATAPLVERTRMTTEIVVRQAGLKFADLDRILLVGGSARMPMIARMLEELTGKTLDRSISADEAVAHGAALYANLLTKPASADDASEFTVTNVNSHSLGILGTDPSTGAKFNKILIPKNTALPCTVTKSFQTYRPGQQKVLIKVLEGESGKPGLCISVGVCTIGNLPPHLPAGWPIEVSYTYQSNGQLHLTAQVKNHPTGTSMDFLHENSLPDEDVEIWAHYVDEELAAANL